MIFKQHIDSLNEIERSLISEKSRDNFDSIMEFSIAVFEVAKGFEKNSGSVNQEKEHPLVDVVRLIGRKLQTQYLTNLLYQKDESDLLSLYPKEVLFDTSAKISLDGKTFEDIKRELNKEKVISLNRDLVLPWSWKTSRMITCIAEIGRGRRRGPWSQDCNHYVELWLPMGIAWVYGGNHSISTGIIQGKGEIIPRYVYDISDVYDYVYSDGENYYRKEDGFIISPVKNVEMAAVFEIGRIMKENSISF